MNEILQDEIAQWILIVGIMLVAIALRMWMRRRSSSRPNRNGCSGCSGCSGCQSQCSEKTIKNK